MNGEQKKDLIWTLLIIGILIIGVCYLLFTDNADILTSGVSKNGDKNEEKEIINESYNGGRIDLEGSVSNYGYKIYDDYDIGGKDLNNRGYYIDSLNQPDAPYWFVITSGVKNTGGYSIYITDLKVKNDKVIVTVKETSPSNTESVIQVLTYPVCALELSEMPKSISIVNTEGVEFNYLG